MRGLRVVIVILLLITFTASACALTWPFMCTAELVPTTYGTWVNDGSASTAQNTNISATIGAPDTALALFQPYTTNQSEVPASSSSSDTSTSTPSLFTSMPSLGISNSISSFPSLSLDTQSALSSSDPEQEFDPNPTGTLDLPFVPQADSYPTAYTGETVEPLFGPPLTL